MSAFRWGFGDRAIRLYVPNSRHIAFESTRSDTDRASVIVIEINLNQYKSIITVLEQDRRIPDAATGVLEDISKFRETGCDPRRSVVRYFGESVGRAIARHIGVAVPGRSPPPRNDWASAAATAKVVML